MANREIREVAESLIGSFSPQTTQQGFSHQSLSYMQDDILIGYRYGGRMSPIRRFFCLFILFDFLFTSLLWLICVMMRGVAIVEILENEVLHYSIKVSLFDIVTLSAIRFLLLLLFYGLLYINNWSVIAISTAGTCAFLLAKVFVLDWPDTSQPVYQVFLIITSFVLAWGEAWFLDFRVLPQEMHAKNLRLPTNVGQAGYTNERTPLIQGAPSASNYESVSRFFSPIETPETSPRPAKIGQPVILTQEQIEEYKERATNAVHTAWSVINQPGWKTEKKLDNGDIVESMNSKEYGKVFRFTGVVDCPAKFLFTEVGENLTRLPEWNPTILQTHYIKQLDCNVDISYQVTAGGGNGIIAPRDFVTLRRCARLRENGEIMESEIGEEDAFAYISAGVSVECPGYPPTKDYVRGENKVGCWCIKPLMSKTSAGKLEKRCTFQWMLSCNLKGRIPQFVIDTAFSKVMLDYVVYVRRHIRSCKEKQMF